VTSDPSTPLRAELIEKRKNSKIWATSLHLSAIHLQKLFRRNMKLMRRWWAYRQLQRLGLIDCFRDYPPEAIKPKYHQLYALYKLVRKRKPAVLLELGGGYSTFAFAQACCDLAKAGHVVRFHSVDGSEYWQGVVKKHMPPELKQFVNFHRVDMHWFELDGESVSAFRSLPVEEANLVFVDGGGMANALLLEKNAPSDYAILVDGRTDTVAFLRRRLHGDYMVKSGPEDHQTFFELKT
jgi:hypothetical protein